MSFSVNPMLTTTAAGMFGKTSNGYIAGMTMDSPAIRNSLQGGVVDAAEATPMWGGLPVSEFVRAGVSGPAGYAPKAMGSHLRRATAIGGAFPINGFTVFDQAHHMIATPQSQVPLAAAGMSVHYYELGSNARIALPCDPALVDHQGGLITANISWDFVAQQVVEPAGGAYLPVKIMDVQIGNCLVVVFDPVTGLATWNPNGSCILVKI